MSLSASPSSLTDVGMISLAATTSGGSVRKVEFYGRRVASDSLDLLGEDSNPPYQLQYQMHLFGDNGNWEFVAKAYEADGNVVTSNSATVRVAIVDNRPLAAIFTPSQDRITTPGSFSFTVSSNKPLARIEVDRGDAKVAESLNPPTPGSVSVNVTAADNGTASYVVKAIDATGSVVTSEPFSVTVDIRWDLIKNVYGPALDPILMATDPSGALYFAATATTFDMLLVKTDGVGNQLWSRSFGGPGMEQVRSLTIDPSGRVYVVGSVAHPEQLSQPPGCPLLLYDASGTPLRAQLVDPPSGDAAGLCVAAADREGNVYVAGAVLVHQVAGAYTISHAFLRKCDRDGNALWTKEFGTNGITGITLDALSNSVYLSGATNGSVDGAPARGVRDLFVLKYDPDGSRVWASQYGSTGLVVTPEGMTADPNGGVYVVGEISDPNDVFGPSTDMLLVHVAADGTVPWAKRLDGGSDEAGRGVVADSKAVYVVGQVPAGDTAHDFTEIRPAPPTGYLAKFSTDGNTQFIRLLAHATLINALITPTGDILAAGRIGSSLGIARHHDAAP